MRHLAILAMVIVWWLNLGAHTQMTLNTTFIVMALRHTGNWLVRRSSSKPGWHAATPGSEYFYQLREKRKLNGLERS